MTGNFDNRQVTSGGASIAAWPFFGHRTAAVSLGNGLVCSWMNNAQNLSAFSRASQRPPFILQPVELLDLCHGAR